MRVTAKAVKILTRMEDKTGLPYLSFLLLSKEGNASALKTFMESLYIDKNLALFICDQIKKETGIEIPQEIIGKAMDSKSAASLDKNEEKYEKEAKEIIEHFNHVSKSRMKLTKERKKRIIRLLKEGYTKEDFFNVHIYFYETWGSNPKMAPYFRPSTLYNGKFEERVTEAKEAMKSVFGKKQDIEEIINEYKKAYVSYMHTEPKDIENIGLELLKTIGFWMDKGCSKEEILATIRKSVALWSQKKEIAPHISLAKIFDGKFPERISAVKNYIAMKGYTYGSVGSHSLQEWVKEKKKRE